MYTCLYNCVPVGLDKHVNADDKDGYDGGHCEKPSYAVGPQWIGVVAILSGFIVDKTEHQYALQADTNHKLKAHD